MTVLQLSLWILPLLLLLLQMRLLLTLLLVLLWQEERRDEWQKGRDVGLMMEAGAAIRISAKGTGKVWGGKEVGGIIMACMGQLGGGTALTVEGVHCWQAIHASWRDVGQDQGIDRRLGHRCLLRFMQEQPIIDHSRKGWGWDGRGQE
ncbi:hypothetical protein DFJ73DRAFT_764933 [Zopfochytrium polystomum]|nr:hypothetical protein DFJ73DRAFT_764933 [Zopfochytrium polystomum]